MPLFDIVVCVQLHINYIYGLCTNVLNIYSFLDAYSVFYCMCTLKIDLFNVLISKCDAVVQYIQTIYKGKSMCIIKQSDQILSRRFLCSLVLLIKRQEYVPLICFLHFVTGRCGGKTWRYRVHRCLLYLFC